MDVQNATPEDAAKKRPKKRAVIILCIAAFVVIAVIGNLIPVFLDNSEARTPTISVISGDEADPGTVLSKTVMVYLDGCDLEEKCQNSTRTIREILASGVDTERHNILLYTGGSDLWHDYNIPTDKDCIYLVKNNGLQLLQAFEPQNLGDGQTLQTFMQYCVTNYPSPQYGLILQNHGGGPNNGVCVDFRHNSDILTMRELQTAFGAAGFGPNAKMEFVFFDACLMASSEVAFSLKDYAHYMVASENVSYTYGSDYSFIKAIDYYNSGAQIGTRYVDCFYNASIKLSHTLANAGYDIYDITYSCINLSKMDKVEQSVNELFAVANQTPSLAKTLSSTAWFARGVMEYADSYGVSTDTVYDLIDLDDWMRRANYAEKTLTDNVRAAVDSAVIYNRANTPRMHGLTIYYPKNIRREHPYTVFGFSDEYSEYVKQCYIAGKAVTSALPWETISTTVTSDSGLSKLSVRLTDEQRQKFASAQYYILAKYSGIEHVFTKDEYVLVDQGSNCTLTDNVLSATYDNRVPVLYKKGSAIPFCSPLFRKVTDDGKIVYSTYASLEYVPDLADYPGEKTEDGLSELQWQINHMRLDVAWLTLQENDGALDILYGEIEENNGLPSRVLINPSDYQNIRFFNPIRRVQYDETGKLLPVSKWTVDNTLTMNTSVDVEDLNMQLVKMPEEVKYYGVMVLKDTYGNEYSTDILPLN